MSDTSVIAAKYQAEAVHAPLHERGRWPLKWTIAFAVTVSLGLWALIFFAARALWTLVA
ncbi:MAG: hypothetical protein JNJ73_16840 [Hyphomonadaceae bacterium]|nr:hypothetical protein [Hyphomonadaceae bacterium]